MTQFLQAARATSTGQLVSSGATLRGVHLVSSGSAGRITLTDGGSSGTTKLDVDTPAVAEGDTITIPDPGIKFDTDVHLKTLSNVDGITIFYMD